MVERLQRRAALNWRKGSASSDADDCVEVAGDGRSVLVRDSRNPAAGLLALDPTQWHALLRAIRNGELDGR